MESMAEKQIIEAAQDALLSRRQFSLRFQIYLGFILVFVLAAAIAAVLLASMVQVEQKLNFLEIVNDYVIAIQQTRHYEKNYFLYGTNLNDAMDNFYQARHLFDQQTPEMQKILGAKDHDAIRKNLKSYQDMLDQLVRLDREHRHTPEYLQKKSVIEADLRRHGHEMISLAQDLMSRLKVSASQTLHRSRMIHIYFTSFLLVFVIFNGYILGSRILGSIRRFAAYAGRIASGDFTPIMPKRRFRDEFTDLALAINHMMEELKNREEALIQLHKIRAVGTLTAGVAHELNNPLNNIMLSSHVMLEDFENLSDEEKKDILKDIVDETHRSKNIISNLLDFVRQSSSNIDQLDIVTLLQDTIRLASNEIKLSGIKIEFQASDNLPKIYGDTQQLRQVFLNLILNAIDASSKGNKIQVFVTPADEPNYVSVKILDFGSGIPEHILNSIFDPFFTTKGKGKGTGLGLSVSQGIITKHGGRIQVNSKEGKGSTFTVTLPVIAIPADITTEKMALSFS
jgi:two-component system, NtrC family, sensor kinase